MKVEWRSRYWYVEQPDGKPRYKACVETWVWGLGTRLSWRK